jgi:hypothetical protein
LLLVAPVRLRREGASDRNGVNDSAVRSAAATLAIIEILARPDASPSVYRGQEQFLIAVCELAADYHSSLELERLRKNDAYRDQLLRLGRVVHRQLDLQETAYGYKPVAHWMKCKQWIC